MRLGWMLVPLLMVSLAGCFGNDAAGPEVTPPDLGYDPGAIQITGTRRESFQVTSFDGTVLDSVAYLPLTSNTLPDGSAVEWPVVVFLHGWGFFKEQFEGFEAFAPGAKPPEESGAPEEFNNVLQRFASQGILAVAYDARGFGRSTGQVTMAGPAEMADLDAVLDYVEGQFDASDRIGVTGVSYGGGQSLLALTQNDRIVTAVPMFGWADLYDGLVPGNVPKLEWAEALYAIGLGGGAGKLHPMVVDWYEQMYTRSDLGSVEAAMDLRSSAAALSNNTKPIFTCQGMQETLLPQVQETWELAGGFTRAYVYTGGHSLMNPGCMERALDWFHFWLGGFQTGVAAWPALETQDADGGSFIRFNEFPEVQHESWFLRDPDLSPTASPSVTFEVEQRIVANPFSDPSVVIDFANAPAQAIPEQFRQDPAAVQFATPEFLESAVLVGKPELRLSLVDQNQTGWQVAATLFHVDANDRSRIIARGAYAALNETHLNGGTVDVDFPYTKVHVDVGDKLVLKLAGNDASYWMPLLLDYRVAFDGNTELVLPMFVG